MAKVIDKKDIDEFVLKIYQLNPFFGFFNQDEKEISDVKVRLLRLEKGRDHWDKLEEKAIEILGKKMGGYIHWRETVAFVFVIALSVAILKWALQIAGPESVVVAYAGNCIPFSTIFFLLYVGIVLTLFFIQWVVYTLFKKRLRESLFGELSQKFEPKRQS